MADEAEACDLDPEGMDGFRDSDGCPEPNDDLDELPDAIDACPNQRESANGWQDGDGCSDILPDTLLDIELLTVGRRRTRRVGPPACRPRGFVSPGRSKPSRRRG